MLVAEVHRQESLSIVSLLVSGDLDDDENCQAIDVLLADAGHHLREIERGSLRPADGHDPRLVETR